MSSEIKQLTHCKFTSLASLSLGVLSLALLSTESFAGVYKCETTSGQITYQSMPCTNASKQSQVRIRAAHPKPDDAPVLHNVESYNADDDIGPVKQDVKVRNVSGMSILEIPTTAGRVEQVFVSSAERYVESLASKLKQAEICDVTYEKSLKEWTKKRKKKLQEAVDACKRSRSTYCDTRDPEKILRLYTLRDDPTLDIPNDPREAEKRVAQANRRLDEEERDMQTDPCPNKTERDQWRRDLKVYTRALAEAEAE